MCLAKLTKDEFKKCKRTSKGFLGYKVVRISEQSGPPYRVVQSLVVSQVIKRGWINRQGTWNIYPYDNSFVYKSGCHIYTNKEDAEDYILFSHPTVLKLFVLPVYFYKKDIVSEGIEKPYWKDCSVVVVKKYFVTDENYDKIINEFCAINRI